MSQKITFSNLAPSKTLSLLSRVLLMLLLVTGKIAYSQAPQTFSYTGATQTYTVQFNGPVQIEAWGAQGGANWVNNTNYGGYTKAVYNFTAGTVLNIFVGGQPSGLAGGFNGGGTGEGAGKGGGGATDVRINGNAFTDRIIVAGGGGGAGYWSSLHVVGGVGGGLTGGDGYRNTTSDPGGQGGTQTGSGVGTCVSLNNPAVAGGLGFGGSVSGCGCEGYGGGAGYYGGAGSGNCRGGGGGSGYILPTATNTLFTNGIRTGHGQLVITPLFTAIVTQTNVSCNGSSNGAAAVSPVVVPGPYTYSWTPSGSTSSLITGLAAGSYTCVITAPTATTQAEVIITQPTALVAGITSQTNASCFGFSNGAATFSVTGGTGAYSYTWMPAGGNAIAATALAAGNYTLTVKDANNCFIYPTAAITQPASFSIGASATNPTICSGGSTTLNGSGATSYNWTGGITNGVSFSPGATTTYSLTGTNAFSCPASNTVVLTVTVHLLPVISATSGSICSGSSFTIPVSGASTYTFTGGTNIVSPAVNTSYSVTGTSSAGCISAAAAVSNVTVVALPIIAVNSGSICSGQSFTITASGASTYTYTGGNAVVSPISTTSYSVTGTSSVGCLSANTAVSSVTVMALPVISVNSGSICAGESFTIIPSGANTYTFTGGNAVVSPVATTSYSISGTDVTGCVSAQDAVSTVTVNQVPVITVNNGAICAGESFTITPAGAATYTFSGGNAVVTPLANTSYSVTGMSAEGCAASNTAISTVTVNTVPLITVNSGSICAGQSFTMTASGAVTYTYSGGNQVVSPASTSNYSVTGSSAEGCVSAAAIATITVNALPVLIITQLNSMSCVGETAQIGVAGANTYSWNTGETGATLSVSPLVTTSYTVEGYSAEGCMDSAVITQSVSDCTGIQPDKTTFAGISVYPNPSHGVIHISANVDVALSVINELGQEVCTIALNAGNNHQASVDYLPNGLYFISGQSAGQVIREKIIIAR